MIDRFVPDSSVLVAAFRAGETNSDAAFRLLFRLLKTTPTGIVPETVLVEVVAALWRRTQDDKLVDRAISVLQSLPGLRIVPLPPRRTLIDVARRSGLRGMDCVVVATALAHQASLITFDREMRRLARAFISVATVDDVMP